MNLRVDKNLLTYLGEKRMRIDELFVIMCYTLDKLDLLKVFLQGRSDDQCIAFMQSLERKGLMKKLSNIEGFDWDNYTITVLGNDVYEDCVSNIIEGEAYSQDEAIRLVTSLQGQPVSPESVDISIFANEFLNLWPQDARNINGDKLRSNVADTTKKLGAFIKKYRQPKEKIIEGTKRYLERQSRNGYAYCNQAMYFISKDGISKLANECENTEETNSGAWENVM